MFGAASFHLFLMSIWNLYQYTWALLASIPAITRETYGISDTKGYNKGNVWYF